MKSKTPFKLVFMDTIPATYSKCLTKGTILDNYLLILDSYSNIPKLYGMENITTEEVMDKIEIFQFRFVKVDESIWWYMDKIQTESGT